MHIRNILLWMVCLWCIAVKTVAQTPVLSDAEKEKAIQTQVQRYLLKYKQDLNNALDRNDFATAISHLNHIILYEPNNGQALYLRARGFENMGLYERAIFDYDNAQRVGYKEPQLFYFLARLEIKAGLGEESFYSFNEFFQEQPGMATKKELRYERGIAAKMAKEYKACVEDMSFVIDEGKDEADAYFNRAICFSELDLLKEAKKDFHEAVRIKPALKDHWYYITYDRIYKNSCKQSAPQYLAAAQKQMAKGNYFDAFIEAQLGLKCYPGDKALMIKQLEAMLTQIDLYYDETIVFYQEFVKKHGADEVVQAMMDKALAKRKQITVSDKSYVADYVNETPLPERFRKPAEYLKLAEDKLQQKTDLPIALDYCNNAIRIDPKSPDAFLVRARVLYAMNSPLETAMAWKDATQATKMNPKLSEAWTIRGMIAYQENNLNAALADLTKAVECRKDNAEAAKALAKVQDKLGSKTDNNQ